MRENGYAKKKNSAINAMAVGADLDLGSGMDSMDEEFEKY
jgi:hypothetical protein